MAGASKAWAQTRTWPEGVNGQAGGGAIYAAINHKKIRFNCCGKNMDLSVDILLELNEYLK